MPSFWQGGNITLPAYGSGTLRLRIAVDGIITQFMINNTGRCAITNMEIAGVADFFEGIMELDQFKQHGNIYTLPEPIAVTRGSDLVVSLMDISGSTNIVYFAVHISAK